MLSFPKCPVMGLSLPALAWACLGRFLFNPLTHGLPVAHIMRLPWPARAHYVRMSGPALALPLPYLALLFVALSLH